MRPPQLAQFRRRTGVREFAQKGRDARANAFDARKLASLGGLVPIGGGL
jgi:hypothetical protein